MEASFWLRSPCPVVSEAQIPQEKHKLWLDVFDVEATCIGPSRIFLHLQSLQVSICFQKDNFTGEMPKSLDVERFLEPLPTLILFSFWSSPYMWLSSRRWTERNAFAALQKACFAVLRAGTASWRGVKGIIIDYRSWVPRIWKPFFAGKLRPNMTAWRW